MAARITRRAATAGLAAAAILPGIGKARAQTYPPAGQTIKVVVPFVAGGTTDIVGRVVAERLSAMWGVPFIVENVPGAGANLGMERVAKGPADGTVLVVVTPNLAINQFMYSKMPFDPEKDITPLCQVISVPNLLCVRNSLPVNSMAELIAYAKANPGKLNFASSGVGTSIHLSAELFKRMTGAEMAHVAYRGSPPALTDLIGGQVDLMFDNIPTCVNLAREGKIRPLGVTTAKRSAVVPEYPAIAETLPGYDATSFFGIGVPSGVPQAIRDRIERDVRELSQEKSVKERFAALAVETVGSSGQEFAAFIAAERERWGKIITELKIKVD